MNKTLIFRKIGGIISEITEQYQYLAENPENINPLELELFVANSHFLSEHLAILKKLGSTGEVSGDLGREHKVPEKRPVAEPVNSEGEPNEEPSIDSLHNLYESTQTKNEEAIIPETDEQLPVEPANLFHEPTRVETTPVNEVREEPEAIPEIVIKETSVYTDQTLHPGIPREIGAENTPIKKEEPVITKSSVDEKVPTLNELLSAGKTSENIADKISRHEDKDLKSMIKLNDKLMFVRDLFSGYSLAYSEAIELVNRCETFEAAEHFLKQNYALKNKWSDKQSTVDQFYEVLNKRFS